ncbi:MAG: trypsin-like peptidase domain-containing protein [Clostridium sp.]|uniref:S1C family serine protease n=1 Tax=Clostridium sp. TaxID=1506 RepID=UPI002A884AFB|nr:trypsin-like peptidase domain-containing protein [Clostridium sp.]MDY5098335.1 trypsin-like peptidase domain-containing protein [Clostridium sp.]
MNNNYENNNESENRDFINESNMENENNQSDNSHSGFIFENDNKDEFKEFKVNEGPLKETKKSKTKKRGYMSYVAIGLIAAVIGGFAGVGGVIYIAPKSEAFKNTALYQSLKSNSYYGPVSSFADEKGDLTLPEVVARVEPAVVGVATTSISQDMFYRGKVQQGIGSGVIISDEGYVLTNYHVIEGAQEVKVILQDGETSKEVNAKVVNYDQVRDVAVVKITDEGVKMPGVAELGDSDELMKGQQVIAIGNPLGKEFSGTVTSGIISSVNRQLATDSNGKALNFIQTDAAINQGNSGGPLMNAKGQVIGINTAKIGSTGVEGMGFSIPINEIKPKIESLMKPMLKIGIGGRDLTEAIAKENKLPASEGVLVLEVSEFSPAEKAGLKIYDIITTFDGQKVTSVNDINDIKAKKNAGDTVKVGILRDGKEKTIELTLEESK